MAEVEIKGGDELARRLAQIAAGLSTASELRVGFLEGATYPNGTPVALVAAAQNFGAPSRGIPARPFFDRMVAENQGGWPALIQQGLRRSGGDARAALEFAGQILVEQLQGAIVDGSYQANAMATNLLKQRFPMGGQTFADVLQAWHDVARGVTAPAGKPLIHTAHMQNSVGKEVS